MCTNEYGWTKMKWSVRKNVTKQIYMDVDSTLVVLNFIFYFVMKNLHENQIYQKIAF